MPSSKAYCVGCGKAMHVKPSRYFRTKTCSKDCDAKARRHDLSQHLTCTLCGTQKASEEFYKRGRNGKQGSYLTIKQPCIQCVRGLGKTETRRAYSREFSKQAARRLRRNVIEAYGHTCTCCGETAFEFLCIDHVNNDGGDERRAGLIGTALLRHVKRLGYPKDRYQLLCHNCNQAKGYYGYCPHSSVSLSLS